MMERIRLLLVDDEEDFRTTLASRLRKRDFDVTEVESGYRARKQSRGRPIDVAVIDVKMPGMDGLETLREMKRINPLIEVIYAYRTRLRGIRGRGHAPGGLRLPDEALRHQ